MAAKRINPLLIIGVLLAVICLTLAMCSQHQESFQPISELPGYDPGSKRQDGDTQTDTIKALQAYAREAVNKADTLYQSTEDNMEKVLENRQKVDRLEAENLTAQSQLKATETTVTDLQQHLEALQQQLHELRNQQITPNTALNAEGLPVGFGFEDQTTAPMAPTMSLSQGEWHNPVSWANPEIDQNINGFTGLLPHAPTVIQTDEHRKEESNQNSQTNKTTIEPAYTIPKDATLTDGLALTALIGRIPVEGQTPDPYPIKIYVGKENLLANGHELPEVEGMIFSGLGFGDWNLSCVSARLTSATFIFKDGTIVNHTSDGQPLGYISDPAGVPCIEGRFVTNAPSFISQRIGLSALGAAGSAYAQAQQQRQTSPLTGTTTSTVTGDLSKLATGEAVQSATNEVSNWLLARQQQSFDAVVVNPGAAVAVHLNRSLTLDKNSLSRRLRYVQEDIRIHTHLD